MVMIGMLITAVGMFIPYLKFDDIYCYIAFGLLGIGNTVLQVSMNPLLTNVISGDKLSSSLTVGQFIKAVSAFVGPVAAAFCSTHLGGWNTLLPVYGGVSLLAAVWLLLMPVRREEVSTQLTVGDTFKLLSDSRILWLFLGILCVVGLDVGLNTAAPKLLMERAGLSKEVAGLGSSWYFAARTVGTFIGSFLLAKVSERGYFRINMLVAFAALIAMLFVQGEMLIIILICITAFAASSIFAVIFSMALRLRPDKANEISGLMITGVAGGAIFPPLMGLAVNYTGSQIGSVIVIALTAAYLLVCAFRFRAS
jgi:fucose permease